ncbi:MFS transporter, partial [archaeon]
MTVRVRSWLAALSKTYMGEVTTAESISRGFAWLSLTWGVGAVIAPAIGGFLADPVENFPATFGGVHLFELYPYVLPSLVSAAFSFIAFFIGYRHLGETQVYLDAKAEDEASHNVVNDAAEGTPRRAHDGRASRSSSRASAPEQHEAAHASEADSCVEDARPVLRMQAPDVEHGEQQHARSEVGVEDVRTPAALRAAYGRPHQRRHSIVAGEAGSSESARLSEASVHSGARAGAGATLVSSLDAVVSFAGDGVQAEDDALLSPSGDAHTATSSRQRSYEHAPSAQRARRSEEHDVLVSPRSEECTDSEQELVHTPSLASRSHPHANGGSGNDGRGSGSGNGSG